jgi:hypothetical protein
MKDTYCPKMDAIINVIYGEDSPKGLLDEAML